MKKPLFPLLAGCAALFLVTPLQAADSVATFGGFAAGKTFTMTVTERESYKTKGDNADQNVPVPDDMVNFKKGQRVTFVIGRNGQLKGPGFSIRYETEQDQVNTYSNNPSVNSPEGKSAAVSKTPRDKPKVVRLTFYRVKFSGNTPITNTVTYKMEKEVQENSP